MKKTKEEERFRQKQKIKQNLIDRQIAELMKVRDQQEEILNKQVAEAENKATLEFEEKQRRLRDMKQSIFESRANQIKRKQREEDQRKYEELMFSEFWKMRNDELAIAEQYEKEEERHRRVELTNYLKKQMEDKNRKNQEDFVNE